MKSTKQPWEKTPASLEAAREELDAIDRRGWRDQRRAEFLRSALHRLHGTGRIPEVGSRWVRTYNLHRVTGGKPLLVVTELAFHCYGFADEKPVMVFEGRNEKGEPHYLGVRIETFHREFDPAPRRRKKGAGRG